MSNLVLTMTTEQQKTLALDLVFNQFFDFKICLQIVEDYLDVLDKNNQQWRVYVCNGLIDWNKSHKINLAH